MVASKPSNTLSLTRSEVTACKRLAETDGLNGQRATALLAIHGGATQAQAAESSSLSLGQVRYIISRFRLHRIKALETGPGTKPVSSPVKVKAKTKVKKKAKKDKEKKKTKDKKDKNKDKKKSKSDKKDKKDKKKAKKSKK